MNTQLYHRNYILSYLFSIDNFNMDIRSHYTLIHKLNSFSEYQTPRFYENTSKKRFGSIVRPGNRQTFINDTQKLAKQIPGPGKYTINPQESKNKKKFQPKINFEKLQKQSSSKKTFLDDILKRSKSVPSVGKYDIQIDKTQQIRSKYKAKGDSDRKKAPLFRSTILDQVNLYTIKTGPGYYDTLKPLGYKNQSGTISPEKKPAKSTSLPKLPGVGQYDPIPVSYETFQRKSSVGSLKQFKKEDEKKKYQIQTLGPGPKYSLIIDWAIKKGKDGKQIGQNYLSSISTYKSSSIYH